MRNLASTRLASARTPVPPGWRREVERILITERMLARRVGELSEGIERDFRGREMVVVSLLNGTVMFLADLMRHLSLPLRLDFIGVSSYGAGTESGDLVFTKELRLDVRGRDVLLVDDILDTGRTMSRVLSKLRPLKPRRLKTCVLLDKPSRRVEAVKADYVGFVIPDVFVVGYGLDFAERYRNLPFVGVLHRHLYEEALNRAKAAASAVVEAHRRASGPVRLEVAVSWGGGSARAASTPPARSGRNVAVKDGAAARGPTPRRASRSSPQTATLHRAAPDRTH